MEYSLAGVSVQKPAEHVWIAPNATLIGDVHLGINASVWWNVVIRADNERITIGEGSNVQDGSVLHADPGFPLTVGKQVTIGHMAMLHGCRIGDGSMVGIGSVILNGASIGDNCLIGAGCLITEGKEIPDRSVVMGSPGKVVRQLSEQEVANLKSNSDHYVINWQRYQKTLKQQ